MIDGPREEVIPRFWKAAARLRFAHNEDEDADCSAELSEFYDACIGMLDICKEKGARLAAADLGC